MHLVYQQKQKNVKHSLTQSDVRNNVRGSDWAEYSFQKEKGQFGIYKLSRLWGEGTQGRRASDLAVYFDTNSSSHTSAYKSESFIIRLRSKPSIFEMRGWIDRCALFYKHLSFRGNSIRKTGSAQNTNQCDKIAPKFRGKSGQNLEEEVKVIW